MCTRIGISSSNFDIATAALTAAATLKGWSQSNDTTVKLLTGVQGFVVASLADRCLRLIIKNKYQNKEPELFASVVNACVEEALYSLILRTDNIYWAVPRFLTTLATTMTAVSAFYKPAVKPSGFTLDTLIGFGWAVGREGLLQTLPSHLSLPILILTDSVVFGTSEAHNLEKSDAKLYKSLSGGVFRAIANISTQYAGPASAVVQHILFNFSRSLPSRGS